MIKFFVAVSLLVLAMAQLAEAKDKPNVTIRKTQTVDFEGETVDGQARHPDGAYLVQKRSVDFVPLYKVRERFDENIKGSVEYLK